MNAPGTMGTCGESSLPLLAYRIRWKRNEFESLDAYSRGKILSLARTNLMYLLCGWVASAILAMFVVPTASNISAELFTNPRIATPEPSASAPAKKRTSPAKTFRAGLPIALLVLAVFLTILIAIQGIVEHVSVLVATQWAVVGIHFITAVLVAWVASERDHPGVSDTLSAARITASVLVWLLFAGCLGSLIWGTSRSHGLRCLHVLV